MAVINGTNGNDNIAGTVKSDTIYGKNGDDYIWGWDGNDSLHGDKGNDTLLGENGNDNLYGKDGEDWLAGGPGNDNLHGDGGYDYLFGDTGNDVIKGGLGAAYMDGWEGKDDFYYNPAKGKLENVGLSLESTVIYGGADSDTLNLFNDLKYTDPAGKSQHSMTTIGVDQNGTGYMWFGGQPVDYGAAPSSYVGSFSEIEHVKVEGKGGLEFYGGDGVGLKVTGTDKGDSFYSFGAHDTFLGGGGNDFFYFGNGDKIESWTKDADVFTFVGGFGGDTATVKGFNGAGKSGGDVLYLNDPVSDPATQIVESGGKTTFTLDGGLGAVQIDAVGLKADLDYFIV